MIDLLTAWRDWDAKPTSEKTANTMEDVCQQLGINRDLLGKLRRYGMSRRRVVAIVDRSNKSTTST